MYEPSRHLSSFYVAGFQRYDGATVLSKMEAGSPVELILEPENPHDPDAIMIYFDGVKIGYVPRGETHPVSLLSFYGHASAFEARVIQVDTREDPWKQVRIAIYVRDARESK